MVAISFFCGTPIPSSSYSSSSRYSDSLVKSNCLSPAQNLPRPRRQIVFSPRAAAAAAAYPGTAESSSASTYSSLSSSSSSSPMNLYEVLGVAATASGYEIKRAYRNLARVSHPDVVAVGQKGSSADRFMEIHAAYLTLSDPHKRAVYDRDLVFRSLNSRNLSSAAAKVVATGAGGLKSRFSGYTCRQNWETDQCW